MLRGNIVTGASQLFAGFRLLMHPRLRVFVWAPIVLNIFLFVVLSAFLYQVFVDWLNALTDWLPGWLDFLAWIVGFLSAIAILILYALFFTVITNLIAAPFYGFLAERVEQLKTGQNPAPEPILSQIRRTIGREIYKLYYVAIRSIAILLLFIFPPIGQILWAIWSSWYMSVQYCDYAADNNQMSFIKLRATLRDNLLSTHGFGAVVMIGTMIPLLNIFVIPAAVIGGTLLWLDLERRA